MASKADQRKAALLAALQANPDGVSFWQLCIVASLNIANCGTALDELIQAGKVEFVEPDLWRLKPAAAVTER